MTKSGSRRLRAALLASGAIMPLIATVPAAAQLRPVDPNNSVLIDLGAIEGAGPAPRGPLVAPGVAAPSGSLLLPPSAPPQSQLLVPGTSPRAEPMAPSVNLRPPEPEPRREAQRTAPRVTQPKGAAKAKAPVQSVERQSEPPRAETAQRAPLPSVSLPAAPGPTNLDAPTPPPAVTPPPVPTPQPQAAAPPPVPPPAKAAQQAPTKAAKSGAPIPPPAIEPPKPPEATPPPAAAPAPTPPAAQPAPAPTQQAAIPERAPMARPAPAPESMEIRFAAGEANLADDGKARLDKLADAMRANDESRLQLLAYAGEESPSKARRLSLSRALSIRSYLIAKGIRSTRIDVRALGDQIPGGEPNRVDLKVTDR